MVGKTVDANTVVLNQGVYSYDVGGEFTAYTTQNFAANYASVATLNGGFETFCIESTVDFYPGSTYTYDLSSTDSQGRQLTEGAAFLYYEFATGQLAGYDYNTANTYVDRSARKTDAGMLQAAIWWLQGKQYYNDGSYQIPTMNNNIYYNLALSALGSAATNANDGTYGVDVLQMWNGSAAAQNQLVLLPSQGGNGGGNSSAVPDGGLTAGLLGFGMVGMMLLQIRYNRQLALAKAK